MNCKPGDLAIVIRDGPCLGMLVEVLHAAPSHSFLLPDGHRHVGCDAGDWVLLLLGRTVLVPCERGSRMTQYCVGKDSSLRPLRGEREPERVADEIAV